MIKLRAEWRRVKEGAEFERLTVLGPQFRLKGLTGVPFWVCVCRCKCGIHTVVRASELESRHVKSCGCFSRDTAGVMGKSNATHGETHTKLHDLWVGMRQRCSDPNHSGWKHYGGRGISVCSEWQDYVTFRDWALSHGYKPGLQIDRFPNNDGNYEPGNCRFATAKENLNNRRFCVRLTWNGETKTLAQWGEDSRCAVSASTFRKRIEYGWGIQEAMTKPAER